MHDLSEGAQVITRGLAKNVGVIVVELRCGSVQEAKRGNMRRAMRSKKSKENKRVRKIK